MSAIPSEPPPGFSPDAMLHARARQEAVHVWPPYRITVLTPAIVRIERDSDARFEDRPTFTVTVRNGEPPPHEVRRVADRMTVRTELITLEVGDEGVSARSVEEGRWSWREGEREQANLGGTARTLDQTNGGVALSPGLVARDGYVILDDSATPVFDPTGWFAAHGPGSDRYLVACGLDYRRAVREFVSLSGRVPMLPRFALGVWWSRYWAYSAEEIESLVDRFHAEGAPLSVCMLDMDWHVVDNPHHDGWTGYTWNRGLFPDPAGFCDRLHRRDVRVGLNLHPAGGVHPHEDAYDEMRRAFGLSRGHPIPFDAASRENVLGHIHHLNHPRESEGVDFWWIDWQQGEHSSISGLDPMMALNHSFAIDRAARGRAFILSRYAGLGSHRYPVGFSGDTIVSWESLALQPRFTATAANVGYGWWSHDVGGHLGGDEDPERYVRWAQYAVWSPILRIHSCKLDFIDRRPWRYPPTERAALTAAMRLRNRLVPWLYSLAWQNHVRSEPPIVPMYWDYPSSEPAYHAHFQYLMGGVALAAPAVWPRDPDTGRTALTVWLPPGLWYEWDRGIALTGGREIVATPTLEETPVYVKAGAVVPLGEPNGPCESGERIRLRCFVGADGAFELFEDDDEESSAERAHHPYRVTLIKLSAGGSQGTLRIVPRVHGAGKPGPLKRYWTIEFVGMAREPDALNIETGDGTTLAYRVTPDPVRRAVVLVCDPLDPETPLVVRWHGAGAPTRDPRHELLAETVATFRMQSILQHELVRDLRAADFDRNALLGYSGRLSGSQKLCVRALLDRYAPVGGDR